MLIVMSWRDRRDAQGCLDVLPNPLLYYHVYIVIVTLPVPDINVIMVTWCGEVRADT